MLLHPSGVVLTGFGLFGLLTQRWKRWAIIRRHCRGCESLDLGAHTLTKNGFKLQGKTKSAVRNLTALGWIKSFGLYWSPRLRINAGTSRSSCGKLLVTLLLSWSSDGVSRVGFAGVRCKAGVNVFLGGTCVWAPDSGASRWGCGNSVGLLGVKDEAARALEIATAAAVAERSRCCDLVSRKPVAMTVIFTSSFIFSSSTAPKMMLASSNREPRHRF